jgi:hypothetical protein
VTGDGRASGPSSLGAALYTIAVTALVQASLALLACMLAGNLSGRGVEPYLRASVLVFGLLGSYALAQGIKAEKASARQQAFALYGAALVNHFVAYASVVAPSSFISSKQLLKPHGPRAGGAPHLYGPHKTLYNRFVLAAMGVWVDLFHALANAGVRPLKCSSTVPP